MDAGKMTIRLAVFGNPVRKSLSPRIHQGFARQFGLDIDYRAIEVSEGEFESRVRQLAADGALGCNVTLPFKHMAFKLAQQHSETARRALAANTLVFGDDWFADNTDGRGLVDDLSRLGLSNFGGKRVALLGAGGAAAGVLAALLMAGPEQLVIANRTLSRAQSLADSHADLGQVQACTPDQLESGQPFELLINATSQGHQGQAPDIRPGWLVGSGLLYDLNYGSAARPLETHCAQQDIRYSDGLGMLVGQAAESFELWTGKAPDRTAVLDQLRREIRA